MHRLSLRRLLAVLFFLLVASCSGGGCSGCASGCGGTTPLAGGFPPEKAVPNAAAVRISRPGLDELERRLGAIAGAAAGATDGKLAVGIPESDLSVDDAFSLGPCPLCVSFDIRGKICPGGPNPTANPPRCSAEVDLKTATFTLDAVTPSAIVLSTVLPVALDDTPIAADIDPGPALTIHVGYGANTTCTGSNQELVSVDPKALPVKITIPLVAETTAPRVGYTKVDVDAAVVDLGAIGGDDVRICADCGILSNVAGFNICNSILNAGAIKNTLVTQLRTALGGQIKSILRDQLCTAPSPTAEPPCPTGSAPDPGGRHCVYDTDKARCVPALLGSDAHIELGGLLRSISPGTTGGIDFALAAVGPMEPFPKAPTGADGRSPNGLTLGLLGGFLPQPPSKCVTPKEAPPPVGLPIPDELTPTGIDPAGTPQVSVALAGRFLAYAFTNLYNSGLFCLGVSSEQIDLLKTGLLSLLIPSLKTLTFEQSDAAAAIATRPQEAPVVTIGGGSHPTNDPLVRIKLPRFSLDFYVWSFDRFARVFTYTGDLTIPLNLQSSSGGIVPSLGDIKVENGQVENADKLLLDDPTIVAGAVSSIFGTVAKQLVGNGLAPINLSQPLASLGVGITIESVKKLSKGSEDYVGLFGKIVDPPKTTSLSTRAVLEGKRVWAENLQAWSYDAAALPELDVALETAGADGRPLEYSWWIDKGTRSAWAAVPSGRLHLKDDQLFVQGRHVLHVASRLAGESAEEAAPAEVPYVIDALPPIVKVSAEGREATVDAWDLVTDRAALRVRYRLDGASFGAWTSVDAARRIDVGDARDLDVEVKDEEGNVRTIRQALRGRSDPSLLATGSGCGCSTPGERRPDGWLALAGAALALGLLAHRRRRAAGLGIASLGVVLATSEGCSCGSEAEVRSGCGADCNQTCQSGLRRGQPGAYLSVARASDGTVWVAGYNDALLSEGDALLWGDLVVGPIRPGAQEVEWETVDGVPTRTDGTCPAYASTAWRRGETDSGDNVGRWTSLQIGAGDRPIVSYYDDTHHRLKLAVAKSSKPGSGFDVFVVRAPADARGDVGRQAKLLIVSGKPVLAFAALEPGNAGRTRSKIVVARSKVELPTSADDFAFDDVAVDEDAPCRPTSCADGDVCVASGTCQKRADGCARCGITEVCVAGTQPTCERPAPAVETYLRGLGASLGIAASPDGKIALVTYDGHRGNLLGYADRGSVPFARLLLDGERGVRGETGANAAVDTGDVGIAATLALGPTGTWHVAYVHGTEETLRYVTVDGDRVGTSIVVDDGTTTDGRPNPDGKHLVGDDATIRVDGERLTILYADASALGIRRATSTDAGKTWRVEAVAAPQAAERWFAFPRFVPGEERIAAWWRQSTRLSKTVEGNVTLF